MGGIHRLGIGLTVCDCIVPGVPSCLGFGFPYSPPVTLLPFSGHQNHGS